MKTQRIRKRIYLCIALVLPLILASTASIRLYDRGKSFYAKIQLFNDILRRIDEDYVEEKDPQKLVDEAISGMVSSLDPHTTYLTKEQFERWSQNFAGYSGIGISYDIIRNKITVMSVLPGGPSEKVGLKAGDRIVAINGESAIGIKRDEVPLKLMGPRRTKVEVSIERTGWPTPQAFTIIRDEVHVKSVPYAFIIRPGVGYVSIIRFSSTTAEELAEALQDLESQGMKQLILDLRDNGGGYLEAAVDVSDLFLPGGKQIVNTRGRIRSSFREFSSTDRIKSKMLPTIVLINRVSASASEIVSGALQDWDRALILGETSFGKGLVQTQYRFRDGSALLMTTARYYTPSGRLIQRPYDDKTNEDYFSEITDGDVRENLEDDKSRPAYRTMILKKTVLGGGGITPHITLKTRNDTLSPSLRKLILAPERFFYTFSEDYIKSHPELRRMDFSDFLRNTNPNGALLQLFLSYVKQHGFTMTDADFQNDKSDIRFFLKQYIAAEIWGNEARYKVQMLRDKQLVEAIGYLPQAEALLKQAYGGGR